MKDYSLRLRRLSALVYAIVILAMSFLFFTNDFGLVDIRKTAVIIGAGIDLNENGVAVTAQIAVPQPSENGENTQFIEIEGEGVTVADALNEINAKTGFLPKLVFCKLIVLGESCKQKNIFEILDYFYRDDYTQLTPLIAMCKGSAAELLSSQMRFGNTSTVSIERLLSDEAKKSGNASTVNLKMLGKAQYSPAAACFMPYIESSSASVGEQGGSEQGQGGLSQSQSGTGDQSGGQSGGQSGTGQSQGGQGKSSGEQEFLCNGTAVFADGMFAGVLTAEQTFALNILNGSVRHVFVPCEAEGNEYVLGLRSCRGGLDVDVSGEGRIVAQFSAAAQIYDVTKPSDPQSAAEGVVPPEVLKGAEETIKSRIESLFSTLAEADCDALGVRTMLYKFHYADYGRLKDVILSNGAEARVKLRSAG